MGRVKDFFEQNKTRVLKTGIIVSAIAIVFVIVFSILHSANLYILVAPENVTVKVNGKEYANVYKKQFIGPKTIEISGDSIETETIKVTLMPWKSVAILRAFAPNGDYSPYMQNRVDYIILKHYISENDDAPAKAFVEKMEKAYYIKNILPLDNNFYNSYNRLAYSTITDASMEEECKALVCLRLDKETKAAENAARELLKSLGYNYDDYVVFKGEIENEVEEDGTM